MTKEWYIKMRWNDDSTTWVPMGLLKNAEPIMLAEYAKTMKIGKEPAFLWWGPHTLHKRSHFLSKVKALLYKNNLKFGTEVPCNIKHALSLDKANGDNAWRKTISREMSTVKVAFKFMSKDNSLPVGYKQIRCHLIFVVHQRADHKAKELRALYPDAVDYIPPNMLEAIGKSVQINAFICRCRLGWRNHYQSLADRYPYVREYGPNYLEFQTTEYGAGESSTFGSEFIAMRTLVETIIGLCYKLQMVGVLLDGPCNVFCDNEPVTNASMSASAMLKCKHISIPYYQAREAVAEGVHLDCSYSRALIRGVFELRVQIDK